MKFIRRHLRISWHMAPVFVLLLAFVVFACGDPELQGTDRALDLTPCTTDGGDDATIADADLGDTADADPGDVGPDASFPWWSGRLVIEGEGQSTMTGYKAQAAISIWAYGGNLMRCDPRFMDGGLDAQAWPGLWALCPATDIMRYNLANLSNLPPNNIFGQTPMVPMADQLRWMNPEAGVWLVDNAGINSAYMDELIKGGDANAYSYTQASIAQMMALSADAGGFQVIAQVWQHGEADYPDPTRTYGAKLNKVANDFDSDTRAQTGQAWRPRTLVWQTGGAPSSTAGPPLSDLAMLAVADTNPLVTVIGAEYGANEYAGDGLHFTARSEVKLGDKAGEVIDFIAHGGTWHPLRMTSVTFSGTVITVHYDVAYPPLQWDELISPPHQVSGDQFAACRGFEPYKVTAVSDAGVVTRAYEVCNSATLGSDGISVVLVTAHDISAADWRIGYATVPDEFSETARPPNSGELCDNDTKIGHFGEEMHNYALHQVMGPSPTSVP